MVFVKTPNLPVNGLIAMVDERCGSFYEPLNKLGMKLLPVPPCNSLYRAVRSHPDMLFHDLGDGSMVYAPNADINFINKLKALGLELMKGCSGPAYEYPRNIGYNAARVGNHVFHNFKYTDSVLLEQIDQRGLHKIHVKQGYSKCSICVIDENSIITADTGIHRAAVENKIESLLIQPQREIILRGLDYGFIGGCTGKIAANRLCIFGDVHKLAQGKAIVSFAESRGVEVISLGNDYPEDFGSILVIGEAF